MTLHSESGLLSIDRLGPSDLIETFGFLDRDPVLNVYLVALTVRDVLAQPRDEFWGVRRESELVALLHIGSQSGAVLPVGDDPAALARLADQVLARRTFIPPRFQVIGPAAGVAAITRRLVEEDIEPRLSRQQRYMSLDRRRLVSSNPLPQLRPARPSDYDLLFETGAQLRAEELHEDPRATDAVAYARRVEEECRDAHTWVWIDDDGLSFRASVSARTPDAAQVSGVYVPPERRGRGLARRALGEMCSRLLVESRCVCLFVNDFNAPALAVYQRLGFTDRASWASAFYDRRP